MFLLDCCCCFFLHTYEFMVILHLPTSQIMLTLFSLLQNYLSQITLNKTEKVKKWFYGEFIYDNKYKWLLHCGKALHYILLGHVQVQIFCNSLLYIYFSSRGWHLNRDVDLQVWPCMVWGWWICHATCAKQTWKRLWENVMCCTPTI